METTTTQTTTTRSRRPLWVVYIRHTGAVATCPTLADALALAASLPRSSEHPTYVREELPW